MFIKNKEIMNKSVMFRFKLSFANVSRLAVHQWNYQFVETVARFISWITERLDRKLAYVIGSNIVEKCDVTLSRAIQPHSTFCASYVSSHISLSLSSTINIGHVLK